MRQIFINLISNSTKFTDAHGSITVHLKLATPEFLECSVADTGIGISSELCKRLFQPYVKGIESINKNKSGAGFGLAITKRLCEKLGGNIKVSSVPNEGATFTFTILIDNSINSTIFSPRQGPYIKSCVEQKMNSLSTNKYFLESPEEVKQKCAQKILCVDDEPIARKMLNKMLEKLKVQFDSVFWV